VNACQHPQGGFGGGHGQMAHLAPTYAAVNILAMYGGEDAFGIVDRKKLYAWLMTLKQKDGGFLMHHGGEEDARYGYLLVSTDRRSAYTALSISTLLNIRTDELVAGTAEWLVGCQNFEGGMTASPSTAEAHGGYAFCVLAALCILFPPNELANRIDLDNLTVHTRFTKLTVEMDCNATA
jgi:protein farnesyltransferase subunit beta